MYQIEITERIWKSDKNTTRKENYWPIFLINIDEKSLYSIIINQIHHHIK